MPTFSLNLREVYTPFQLPTLPQLLLSLKARFPDEVEMTVIPPRRSEQGMCKIIMHQDADNLVVPLKVDGTEFQFCLNKLTAAEAASHLNTNPQAEGKLYTLYQCTSGDKEHIPNSVFATAVSALGRVTRPCEHQKHRGSTFFNGNRFFCMVASGEVPD